MSSSSVGRFIVACLLMVAMIFPLAPSGSPQSKSRVKRPTSKKRVTAKRPATSKKKSTRSSAKSKKRPTRTVAKSSRTEPCRQPGYVNTAIRRKYNAAIRDMRRAGIRPTVTSTWRSSAHQARLHECSRSPRCRRRNPGLYAAMPPGRSLHEAGFAVDISGVASGPRGKKRLTARGRRIVQIMRKNGFRWPYGLADPAHFEADPRRYGYRSARQAIQRSQSTCQSLAASAKRAPRKRRSPASARSRKAAPVAKKKGKIVTRRASQKTVSKRTRKPA
ncbi:MAG: D-alanyl-D-alanine carboxypeptidase family protein [Blastocatellia bacterium]|nr:D-alanyl-D-alanine carboxypeptidase family protein [Blastocatellia bacterium]